MYNVISKSLHTYVGTGYELVDATGVIIVGHFSIDGQLKRDLLLHNITT